MKKVKISNLSQPKNKQSLVYLTKKYQEKICGGGKKPRPKGPWLDSDGYPPPPSLFAKGF